MYIVIKATARYSVPQNRNKPVRQVMAGPGRAVLLTKASIRLHLNLFSTWAAPYTTGSSLDRLSKTWLPAVLWYGICTSSHAALKASTATCFWTRTKPAPWTISSVNCRNNRYNHSHALLKAGWVTCEVWRSENSWSFILDYFVISLGR